MSTDQTLIVNEPGTYSVTVTSQEDCQISDTLIIELADNLTPVIVGSDLSCIEGTALLDAGAGYEIYTWSTNENTQTIEVSTPGIYSVTVADASGCSGETSYEVGPAPLAMVEITGVTSFCDGESSLLEATPGFVLYQWSTGSDQSSINVTQSGTYSVTVTDDLGCVATDSIVITVFEIIDPVIAGPDYICEEESALLDAGSGFVVYQWSTGDSTQTILVSIADIYGLTVTDVNGCVSSSDFELIIIPEDTTEINPQICTGSVFQIGDSIFTSTGTYMVTLTSSQTGCDSTVIINLEVLEDIMTNIDTTICLGDSVVFMGQSLFVAGQYSETLISSYGCDSIVNLELHVTEPVYLFVDTTICPTDSLFAGGQWQHETGIYVDVYTDQNGCDSLIVTTDLFVVSPIEFFFSHDLCEGNYFDGIQFFSDTTYTKYLVSREGCDSIVHEFINVFPTYEQTIDVGICEGDSVLIEGTWYFDSGSITSNMTTDYGCDSIIHYDIEVQEVMEVTVNEVMCIGDSILIGGVWQYFTGQYMNTYLTQYGCDSIVTTNLLAINCLITADVMGSAVPCFADTMGQLQFVVLDGTGPLFYNWYSSDSTLSGQGPIPQIGQIIYINNVPVGEYSISISDSLGLSNLTLFTTVTEPPLLELSLDVLNNNDCANDQTGSMSLSVLGGTLDYTYQWSNGENDPLLENLAAGIYSVTVTDAMGCIAIDSAEITENPEGIFDAVANNVTCYGDFDGSILVEVVQDGTPPYQYSLNGGDFQESSDFFDLGAGTYSVTVIDSNNCLTFIDGIVVETPYELSLDILPVDDELNLGDSVQLILDANFNIVMVEWSPDTSISCTDCPAPWVSPTEDMAYEVTAYDANGCPANARIELTVNDECDLLYIPNVFTPNGDGINDWFTIYAGSCIEQINRLQIFDRWGEMVWERYNFPPNDPFQGWDGYFHEELMDPAVFVYVANVKFINGQSRIFSGDVTLVQ
jgi:gliding motility-associated-like protein